jgi:formate dehydrogenase major subunit
VIRLTVDGREARVPPGTTVLEAAEGLGIRIPTLCHAAGLETAASCLVCAVRIEGQGPLAPACAMPAAEGMAVATGGAEIRAARRAALELLLSDHAGDCIAPCSAACPAGLDIPRFMESIAAGESALALEAIHERLALPGVLGRICPRPCERRCRRNGHDESLAIAALHRYAAGHQPRPPEKAARGGRVVAIVGAGPAGLSAAWFLLRKGHGAVLYDARPRAGGMLRYGIPGYRLPKDALDAEIGAIAALGARFEFNRRWGVDFTLEGLRRGHDAVFIATGAQRPVELRCEGAEIALPGAEFLESMAGGGPAETGGDVIVLGGGVEAVDCARAAVRLGARSVRVFHGQGRERMTAPLAAVEEAEREGVAFEHLAVPVRLERGGPREVRLTCRRGGPEGGPEFTAACSMAIAALGRTVDCSLAEREGLRVTGAGVYACQRTGAANLEGVFAGGDAVTGAGLAVDAVAAGRRAALAIDRFLRGEAVTGEPAQAVINLTPIDGAERAALLRGVARTPRADGFGAEEAGPTPDGAQREARRCLACGCAKSESCRLRALATEYEADPYRYQGARRRFSRDESHPEIVYEPGKCILCGICVRIAARAGEPLGLAVIGRGFEATVAAPFNRPLAEALVKSGRECAEACPTAALSPRGAGAATAPRVR